ncbi:MAG TPA: LEA type 2 family protein [Saprospiraceae bacterium]|nr:LEA type 2 family protein [Saprospiraceae bacterium]
MGLKDLLIISALAITGVYLFKKWASRIADGLSLDSVRFAWGNFDSEGVNVRVFVRIDNSNSVSIRVDDFIGNFFYAEKDLAILKLQNSTVLEKEKTTELSFNAKIPFAKKPADLISIIKEKKNLTKFRIAGTIIVQGISHDVDHTAEYII